MSSPNPAAQLYQNDNTSTTTTAGADNHHEQLHQQQLSNQPVTCHAAQSKLPQSAAANRGQPQQQPQPQPPPTPPQPTQNKPTQQLRSISRNNSNVSSTSSSNKGDFSSTISTANSITSSRSQLSKHQLIASCAAASSTPIRSFQRATISSVVKTRAFDNNPLLQSLLVPPTPLSTKTSASNSQTPSPLSTPVFSRSRSLRMSGVSHRYQAHPHAPSSYRSATRTPDLYSFNSSDTASLLNDSQAKLIELNNERAELKENLEFLECERQVLMDSTKELKDSLQNERSLLKREIDELKNQITDLTAARCRAESTLLKNEMEMNDSRLQDKKLSEELIVKDRHLEAMSKNIRILQNQNRELLAINNELKHMLTEKLKYNGLSSHQNQTDSSNSQLSDCMSIVTELARLRLELNEKEKLIDKIKNSNNPRHSDAPDDPIDSHEMDTLNKFLDRTVECIKSWPEELAGSSHVQNLMKTLLKSYTADHANLCLDMQDLKL